MNFRIVWVLVLLFVLGGVLHGCIDNETDEGKSLTWTRIHERQTPNPAYYHALAFDDDRGRLVAFCGSVIADTWEYDGQRWTEILTEHRPPPAERMSACYHPGLQAVFLIGGMDFENDKFIKMPWLYDGRDWIELDSPDAPPGRWQPFLSFFPDRQSIILFGGTKAQSVSDTWEWRDGHWKEIVTTHHPEAQEGTTMIYDRADHCLVLVGHGKTWSFDGEDWLQRETLHNPPSANNALAWDPDPTHYSLVLYHSVQDSNTSDQFSSQLWRFQNSDWTLEQEYFDHPLMSYPFLFKRNGDDFFWLYASSGYRYYEQDTGFFRLSESGMEAVSLPLGPKPHAAENRLTYDSVHHRFLLFSTSDLIHGSSVWSFSDNSWQFLCPSPVDATYLEYFTFCHDAKRDAVIYVPEQYPPQHTVYELHDGTWTEHPFVEGPPLTDGFSGAFDPDRGRLVVFGSSAETWEYDGSQWLRIETPRTPTPRTDAVMAYDGARKRMILFGGHNPYPASVMLNDTWEYDGATWKKIPTAHAPRRNGSMLSHEGLDRIVLFAGQGVDYNQPAEFWQFDGTDWSPLEVAGGPRDRIGGALGYDWEADRLIFFGGRFHKSWSYNEVSFADTWELQP